MRKDSGRSGLLAELEQVRGALAAWRAMPGKGQRIPPAVWRKAVQSAKKHGLNAVSKALGLDYNCLKRHVAGSGLGGKKPLEPTPAFVEMKPAEPVEDLTCVIEMEKDGGARMRICVKSAGSVDWRRIKEAFLGA